MDDIKLFAKNLKRTGDSNANNKNIQSRYRNGICHKNPFHANNKKRKTTNKGRIRTTKSRKKSERLEKKEIYYKYLGKLEKKHHQKGADKRKKF